LSGFCDALDGVIARLYQQASPFGGFLDSVLDRYADATVYMGIIFSGLCSPFWGVVALTSSLLVSYTRARAEALQIRMESVGLAERPERLIILSIASVAAFFYRPEVDVNVGIIVIAVLATFTVLQRSFYTYRKL
jgi:archaetidylinositol phosphate synthase